MSYARLSKDRMILTQPLSIPSYLETFRQDGKTFSFPVCGDIFRRLRDSDPFLQVDDLLYDTMVLISQSQRESLDIASLEDCSGDPRLFPYQRVGVRWLKHVKKGILADSQGLGKTVQALVAANELLQSLPRGDRILIICTSAKRQEWLDHAKIWMSSGLEHHILRYEDDASGLPHSIQNWHGALICNFQTAIKFKIDLLNKGTLIVDEAHKMRNRGKNFRAIKTLAKSASYVFLLTATPTINLAGDLWPLLHICDPKRFSSYWGFVYCFCDVWDDRYGMKVGGLKPADEPYLMRMLSVYSLRRDESFMENLPKANLRIVDYILSGKHRGLYNDMENGIARLGNTEISADLRIAQITRLRQLAISPRLLFPEYSVVGPDKIDALPPLIMKKTVIFTFFEGVAALIKERLHNEGIPTVSLTGKLTETQRAESLKEFRTGNARAIVVTHNTGGESLDLYEGDSVVLMDLHWHPAGNRSAVRRVIRYGNTEDQVPVTILKSVDTIEDHVWSIITDKRSVTIEELCSKLKKGKRI